MAFTQKLLDFTFDLGLGDFGLAGFTRVKLSGLRSSVEVIEAGSAMTGHADATIYGMTPSDMNKLSTLGIRPEIVRRNSVTIEAGDSSNGLAVLFQGQIKDAWFDAGSMPNTSFRVSAHVGLLYAVMPIPPSTFKGSADVAVIMSGLASQAGLVFVNNGVNGARLSDPYFPGTILAQIRNVAEHANINFSLDDPGKLTIWPRGAPRGSLIPLVSPDTGMIGFPTFTSNGIQLTVLYNPSLQVGTRIKVESSLQPACGLWDIAYLSHSLNAQTPGGQWQTRFVAAPPGYVVVSNGGR